VPGERGVEFLLACMRQWQKIAASTATLRSACEAFEAAGWPEADWDKLLESLTTSTPGQGLSPDAQRPLYVGLQDDERDYLGWHLQWAQLGTVFRQSNTVLIGNSPDLMEQADSRRFAIRSRQLAAYVPPAPPPPPPPPPAPAPAPVALPGWTDGPRDSYSRDKRSTSLGTSAEHYGGSVASPLAAQSPSSSNGFYRGAAWGAGVMFVLVLVLLVLQSIMLGASGRDLLGYSPAGSRPAIQDKSLPSQ